MKAASTLTAEESLQPLVQDLTPLLKATYNLNLSNGLFLKIPTERFELELAGAGAALTGKRTALCSFSLSGDLRTVGLYFQNRFLTVIAEEVFSVPERNERFWRVGRRPDECGIVRF